MEKQKEQTITYGVGRFLIDIPASMQYRGGSYSMRIRNIKEVVWQGNEPEKSAEEEWETAVSRIANLKPIKGKVKAIIEEKEIKNLGKWCKAIFYYGDSFDAESGYLDILLNTGLIGVWIKTNGKISGKDFMYEKSTDLAKAYRPPAYRLGKASVLKKVDSFYLEHGAIDLPFEYKESAEISFYGHVLDKDIEIDIETRVIQKELKIGLLDRAAASIASNYAPGVKLEKIRSGKRNVAGLDGEELIELGIEDEKTSLMFSWMNLGKPNSSHDPYATISMMAGDKDVESKIALWDAILDGMRPAGR